MSKIDGLVVFGRNCKEQKNWSGYESNGKVIQVNFSLFYWYFE